MLGGFFEQRWGQLKTSWKYRLGVLVLLAVAFVALAGMGAATAGPPDSYIETKGLVDAAWADQVANPETGRITTMWTKEVVVSDVHGRTWVFQARDVHQYEAGDQIGVLYDPESPASTLVSEDFVFNRGIQYAAIMGIGAVLVMMVLVVGISTVATIRRLIRRPE